MSSLSVISPCKINLFLNILGKRQDNFHNLQSRFCLLNYGDEMSFNLKHDNQGLMTLNQDLGIKLEDNLIYKAYQLIKNFSESNFSLEVNIKKHIPMGGGLGGGSSNAATTLLVLNHLLKLNLSVEQLCSLGAKLGSDVPFFIVGQEAIVEGRGEIIHPCPSLNQYFLVITPKIHISTKEIFTHPQLKEHYSPQLSLAELKNYVQLNNDCIPIVRKKYCEIGHILDSLVKYAPSSMSGTGASCFCVFKSQEQLDKVSDTIHNELKHKLNLEFTSFKAQTLNISPVKQALELLSCKD